MPNDFNWDMLVHFVEYPKVSTTHYKGVILFIFIGDVDSIYRPYTHPWVLTSTARLGKVLITAILYS